MSRRSPARSTPSSRAVSSYASAASRTTRPTACTRSCTSPATSVARRSSRSTSTNTRFSTARIARRAGACSRTGGCRACCADAGCEPVEHERPLFVEEVAAALEQLEAGVWQPGGHVLAVWAWREHVELALPDAGLGGNLLELEAPRLRKREVVVGPAARPLAHGLDERVTHDRAHIGARGELAVDLRQLREDRLDHAIGVGADAVDVVLQESLD